MDKNASVCIGNILAATYATGADRFSLHIITNNFEFNGANDASSGNSTINFQRIQTLVIQSDSTYKLSTSVTDAF